jgi:hypothetical protein
MGVKVESTQAPYRGCFGGSAPSGAVRALCIRSPRGLSDRKQRVFYTPLIPGLQAMPITQLQVIEYRRLSILRCEIP